MGDDLMLDVRVSPSPCLLHRPVAPCLRSSSTLPPAREWSERVNSSGKLCRSERV
jgi:hypothetical protein